MYGKQHSIKDIYRKTKTNEKVYRTSDKHTRTACLCIDKKVLLFAQSCWGAFVCVCAVSHSLTIETFLFPEDIISFVRIWCLVWQWFVSPIQINFSWEWEQKISKIYSIVLNKWTLFNWRWNVNLNFDIDKFVLWPNCKFSF